MPNKSEDYPSNMGCPTHTWMEYSSQSCSEASWFGIKRAQRYLRHPTVAWKVKDTERKAAAIEEEDLNVAIYDTPRRPRGAAIPSWRRGTYVLHRNWLPLALQDSSGSGSQPSSPTSAERQPKIPPSPNPHRRAGKGRQGPKSHTPGVQHSIVEPERPTVCISSQWMTEPSCFDQSQTQLWHAQQFSAQQSPSEPFPEQHFLEQPVQGYQGKMKGKASHGQPLQDLLAENQPGYVTQGHKSQESEQSINSQLSLDDAPGSHDSQSPEGDGSSDGPGSFIQTDNIDNIPLTNDPVRRTRVQRFGEPSQLGAPGDMRGGSNQKAFDDDTGQVGRLASALSRTASRLHVTRTRSMTNLLFSRKFSILSARRTVKGRVLVDALGKTPDTGGIAVCAPPPSTSALWDHSEERNSRDLGTIDAIRARHNTHPSLSADAADSLSTNRTTCSSGARLWTEPSSTETDPNLDKDSKHLDHDTSSDCDTREALIVPSSSNTSGPEVSQKSETEHRTADQMCEAEALGSVPAKDSPCLDRQPIQRKMLPETNKAVETQQEPFELSEDGKQFSKELELRFALSGCVEIPSGTIPRPSPASSLTTSLKNSIALDLLCYASYGKEQAMTPRHRSIRGAFQNVVAGSSSLRWLRSRGKGRRFSRKPIPEF